MTKLYYCGPQGSFSEEAALLVQRLIHSSTSSTDIEASRCCLVMRDTFRDVFRSLTSPSYDTSPDSLPAVQATDMKGQSIKTAAVGSSTASPEGASKPPQAEACHTSVEPRPPGHAHYSSNTSLAPPFAHAALGIIPIENSIAGSVIENFDLLFSIPVFVVGELYLHIHHHLCGRKTSVPFEETMRNLTRVYSHPMALAQVQKFLGAWSNVTAEATLSTSAAAQHVAQLQSPQCAAICSARAADLFGLDLLANNIEDEPQNFTRFFILANAEGITSLLGKKCSLIMILKHAPGALVQALAVLAADNANLTKLESRPIVAKPFAYRFHLDFELGNSGIAIIDRLRPYTEELRILGVYDCIGEVPF